jgi:hypothetical protein
MPGIVSGCIVVFMLTAGSYLTPILLGGKNSSWFTEQIYNQFITRFNWEGGRGLRHAPAAVHVDRHLARAEAERPDARQHRGEELRRTDMLATKKPRRSSSATASMWWPFFIFLAARSSPPAPLPSMTACSLPAVAGLHARLVLQRHRTEARHVPRPAAPARALLFLRDRGLRVALSVFVGTTNAFLFVRGQFPAKNFFYI